MRVVSSILREMQLSFSADAGATLLCAMPYIAGAWHVPLCKFDSSFFFSIMPPIASHMTYALYDSCRAHNATPLRRRVRYFFRFIIEKRANR